MSLGIALRCKLTFRPVCMPGYSSSGAPAILFAHLNPVIPRRGSGAESKNSYEGVLGKRQKLTRGPCCGGLGGRAAGVFIRAAFRFL